MIYFLYGLIAMSLWFWGKVFRWKDLIDLSSIFEDAQFIGFREAKRRSSWKQNRGQRSGTRGQKPVPS